MTVFMEIAKETLLRLKMLIEYKALVCLVNLVNNNELVRIRFMWLSADRLNLNLAALDCFKILLVNRLQLF